MKWVKRVVLTVVGLVLLLVLGLFGRSQWLLRKTWEVPRLAVVLPTDSATLERGRHLANAIGKCTECHGADFGGKVMIDDGALGRFVAPNLTRGKGGLGASRSDADLATALRHGVGPSGRSLVFMPSEDYTHFSTQDLTALLAYVRSRPPVDSDLPARRIGPVGHALLAIGLAPLPSGLIDHTATRPDSMVAGATVEYGGYLANVGGCTGCHRPNLAGGALAAAPPGTPPPANLTRGGRPWTLDQFREVLRTGRRPDGTTLDSFMPVRFTKEMSDQEIEAVYRYIQSVPPKKFGER